MDGISGILGIAALAFGLLATWLFTENKKWREKFIDANSKLETRPSTPRKVETEAPAKTEADDSVLKEELSDAKGEIKDLKKRVHELKEEAKDLRAEAEKPAPTAADSDTVFDLRQELASAKAEVEEWKEKARKGGSGSPRPEPKKEEKPKPRVEATGDAGEKIAELEEHYESKIESLISEHSDAVKELESKLKSTSRNIDKQRRRADNNDRAYKITQRQLDAAQERIELLEGQLKKANFTSASADGATTPVPVEASKPAEAAQAEKAKAEKTQAEKTQAEPTPADKEEAVEVAEELAAEVAEEDGGQTVKAAPVPVSVEEESDEVEEADDTEDSDDAEPVEEEPAADEAEDAEAQNSDEEEGSDEEDAHEDTPSAVEGESTAILSGAALAAASAEEESQAEAAESTSDEPDDDSEDAAKHVQEDEKTSVMGSLAGADDAAEDEQNEEEQEQDKDENGQLGLPKLEQPAGRLGAPSTTEEDSSVDDAWADLDVD